MSASFTYQFVALEKETLYFLHSHFPTEMYMVVSDFRNSPPNCKIYMYKIIVCFVDRKFHRIARRGVRLSKCAPAMFTLILLIWFS